MGMGLQSLRLPCLLLCVPPQADGMRGVVSLTAGVTVPRGSHDARRPRGHDRGCSPPRRRSLAFGSHAHQVLEGERWTCKNCGGINKIEPMFDQIRASLRFVPSGVVSGVNLTMPSGGTGQIGAACTCGVQETSPRLALLGSVPSRSRSGPLCHDKRTAPRAGVDLPNGGAWSGIGVCPDRDAIGSCTGGTKVADPYHILAHG